MSFSIQNPKSKIQNALFLAALLLTTSLRGQTVETLPTTPGSHLISSLITDSLMEELRWPDFNDYRKHLRNFYAPIGYQFVWSRDGKPTPQARAIIALFEAADAKGINAADYDGGRWNDRIAGLTSETALARFDLAVTITLMRYISDLHIGRINPVNVRFELDIESKKYYLPQLLGEIRNAPDPGAILAKVEPQYDEYRRMQTALAQYRRIAAEAEKEAGLPKVTKVKPGETWEGVPQLARVLKRFGDLAPDAKVNGNAYDGDIVAGMKRFQERHGLDTDGVIAAKTLAALSVPLSQRVKQIQLALERWRWAPLGYDAPPIIVNIPEFKLRALDEEKQKVALTMRVVVGKAFRHQTPIFGGDMKYVVFRPYWSVTPSIQRHELAPAVEKDRSYLSRNNYELVSPGGKSLGSAVDDTLLRKLKAVEVGLRQKPGPSNALGLVKFIFPNDNNVYLHSTPAQTLFARSRRDFSHGCIRVEDPVALATWVLRDKPEWTPEKIRAAMQSGRDDAHVKLARPIPVMIIYTTVIIGDHDDVHFFEDIYGHDAVLENALAAGYPYPA